MVLLVLLTGCLPSASGGILRDTVFVVVVALRKFLPAEALSAVVSSAAGNEVLTYFRTRGPNRPTIRGQHNLIAFLDGSLEVFRKTRSDLVSGHKVRGAVVLQDHLVARGAVVAHVDPAEGEGPLDLSAPHPSDRGRGHDGEMAVLPVVGRVREQPAHLVVVVPVDQRVVSGFDVRLQKPKPPKNISHGNET